MRGVGDPFERDTAGGLRRPNTDRECTQRTRLEDLREADVDTELAVYAAEQLHRAQAVSAERYKVGIGADMRHVEERLIQTGQLSLCDVSERHHGLGSDRRGHVHHFVQAFPIDLAVGRERKLSDDDHTRRDHRRRQALAQRATRGRRIDRGAIGIAHDRRHQRILARAVGRRYRHRTRVTYAVEGAERRLDVAQFDPVTTDLHLSIEATE